MSLPHSRITFDDRQQRTVPSVSTLIKVLVLYKSPHSSFQISFPTSILLSLILVEFVCFLLFINHESYKTCGTKILLMTS
jgi:hypothetical protein